MEPYVILKDLFCKQCKLQFNKKIVYDIHLNIVHKENRIYSGQEEMNSGRKSSVKLSLIKPSKNHSLCLSPRSSLERLEKQSTVTASPTHKERYQLLKRKKLLQSPQLYGNNSDRSQSVTTFQDEVCNPQKKFKGQNLSFSKDTSGPTSYDVDLNIFHIKDRINSELEDNENDIPIATSGVNISVSEEPAIDKSTVHKGKNLYKCIFCDASFSNHISLKIHNKLLHERRTEPTPSQKLDDFESPSRCHTSSTNLNITNFVSSIAFDGENNLDTNFECKHAPGITSTSHKDTNPTGKIHSALPIQKLDNFESPSVFETCTALPTEPWLPVAMPTSLAKSPLNLPGFGKSTCSNNEAILGKVI